MVIEISLWIKRALRVELLFELLGFVYAKLGGLIYHLFGVKQDMTILTQSMGFLRALGFLLTMLAFIFLPVILVVWLISN